MLNAKRLTIGTALLTGSLFSHVYAADNAVNSVQVAAQSSIHATWETLLEQNISSINNGSSTAVDYAAFKDERTKLKSYLEQLGKVSQTEFDAWSTSKQLAFLINAYNAWTVEFILTKYPDLDSIKDLGSFFNSPWDKEFIPLFGKTVSLNDIEHGLIRGSDRYNDPRIHFAVNCASIGCPALREEAYTGDKLEQQLTEQTERFLNDTSRNYIKGKNFYMSSIFKWYGDDFEKGFRGTKSIQSFVSLYADSLTLTDAQKTALSKASLNIKFLDYDWNLNAIK
ncbi:DUF547 domain-containing protein [Psychromonas sp. RZ5]|nr:DUF547 domain-containing protein [Psychromonas sp. RZ5]